jgi:hypothetical protein
MLRFQPNTTFRGPLALLVEWDTYRDRKRTNGDQQ